MKLNPMIIPSYLALIFIFFSSWGFAEDTMNLEPVRCIVPITFRSVVGPIENFIRQESPYEQKTKVEIKGSYSPSLMGSYPTAEIISYVLYKDSEQVVDSKLLALAWDLNKDGAWDMFLTLSPPYVYLVDTDFDGVIDIVIPAPPDDPILKMDRIKK